MDYPFRVQSTATSERRAAVIRAHGETAGDAQAGADASQQFLARVLKLIPAEVIALYQGVHGVVDGAAKSDPGARDFLVWLPWVGLALVLFVRAWGTRDATGSWKTVQWGAVIIAAVSFAVWVISLGHVIAPWGAVEPWAGSVALLVWPFLIPYFYRGS